MENEKCPLNICDGSGIITFEDNSFIECECSRAMHIQHYLGKALLPSAYKNKTFYDFDPKHEKQTEILDKLIGYVRDWDILSKEGIGISLLSKETRIGKSHLACAVAHAIIEQNQKSIDQDIVLFINVTNWIDRWKAFYARFGKQVEEEFIDNDERQKEIDTLCSLDTRMNHADLLILDDIGEVPGSEYVSSKLYSVIEFRTSNNLSVLMTSNHPWEIIANKYGDDGIRITDRLKEKSSAFTFYLDEPLIRKIVKKNKK